MGHVIVEIRYIQCIRILRCVQIVCSHISYYDIIVFIIKTLTYLSANSKRWNDNKTHHGDGKRNKKSKQSKPIPPIRSIPEFLAYHVHDPIGSSCIPLDHTAGYMK